jgi:hypothetical protein
MRWLAVIALWQLLSGCAFFFPSRVGTGTAIADTASAVLLAGGAEGLGLTYGKSVGGVSLGTSPWFSVGFAALVVGSAACIASATEGYTHHRTPGEPPRKPAPAPMRPLDPAGGPADTASP